MNHQNWTDLIDYSRLDNIFSDYVILSKIVVIVHCVYVNTFGINVYIGIGYTIYLWFMILQAQYHSIEFIGYKI